MPNENSQAQEPILPRVDTRGESMGNADSMPRQKEKLALRGRMAIWLWVKFALKGPVHAEGLKNLETISANDHAILACSHISDGDMPTAAAVLAPYLDLAFVNPSTTYYFNFSLRERKMDLPVHIAMRFVGRKHFFPFTAHFDKSVPRSGRQGMFDPDDFVPMKNAMEENGKSLMIAAHSPSWGTLPEKGGVGAVYLAQITKNGVVLPVATAMTGHVMAEDEKIRSFINKPSAKVIIGEPIKLGKIDGIEKITDLIKQRRGGTELSAGAKEEMARIKQELKKQSDLLMQKIAELLPEKNRGDWAQKG
jgi:hypothetical protein